MSETSTKVAPKMPSAEEIALIKKFLNDTTLFLGPDPEIMQNHDLMPRSAEEDAAMKTISDAHTVAKIRDRIQAGCDEGYEMVEQMGAAPGAKWGDIITGVYSAAGVGVRAGAAVCLIGSTVQRNLFRSEDPLGQRFRLRVLSCEVIGTLVTLTSVGAGAIGVSVALGSLDVAVMLSLITVGTLWFMAPLKHGKSDRTTANEVDASGGIDADVGH